MKLKEILVAASAFALIAGTAVSTEKAEAPKMEAAKPEMEAKHEKAGEMKAEEKKEEGMGEKKAHPKKKRHHNKKKMMKHDDAMKNEGTPAANQGEAEGKKPVETGTPNPA
jgi:hypothetical protein